jgi:catechol 2,3-dioxygenase-like lactoylglutathione lyase family enzyme
VRVTLADLLIGDDAVSWAQAGFTVDPGLVVGSTTVAFAGVHGARGVTAWSLSGLSADVDDIDGVTHLAATTASTAAPHPNGVIGIDHVVLMTPHLTRTQDLLAQLGLDARRVRDAEMFGKRVQQVFYRLGDVILEVIGDPEASGEGPASLWGITFTVADLDATAAFFGEGLGRVKDAVQPGRRIATLRGDAYGISVPVAFLSQRA